MNEKTISYFLLFLITIISLFPIIYLVPFITVTEKQTLGYQLRIAIREKRILYIAENFSDAMNFANNLIDRPKLLEIERKGENYLVVIPTYRNITISFSNETELMDYLKTHNMTNKPIEIYRTIRVTVYKASIGNYLFGLGSKTKTSSYIKTEKEVWFV